MRERRALFVFATSAEDEYFVLALPVRAELVSAVGEIDVAQPPIAAIAARLTGDMFINPFGHTITELVSVHYDFTP